MAFTDDFSNGTGATQLLSARPGWSLAFGTDCLGGAAGATVLQKLSPVTASVANAYYRTDDASATQYAGADLLNANLFVFVFGSGADAASFNCYGMRQASATTVRVYKIVNGNVTASLLINATVADTLGMELRAVASAGSVALTLLRQGTTVGTATDSTSPLLTGRRGLLTNTTAASTAMLDNYQDNYAVANNLAIVAPAVPFYEGIRKPGVLPVNVTYANAPTSVQARLVDKTSGNAVTGFDWSTKVASPAGTSAAFTFDAVPVGGPYRVEVRDGAIPATVTAGQVDRYVGAIIVMWGQSQCYKLCTDGAGLVTVNPAAKAFTLLKTNTGLPGQPVFAAAGTGTSSGIAAGINQWCADGGTAIPIMVVGVNQEGTSITQWVSNTGLRPSYPQDGSWYLWNSDAAKSLALTMLNAANNQASVIFHKQGTADVSPGDVSGYATSLDQLKAKFDAALPGNNAIFAIEPHSRSNDGDAVDVQNMRQVQYGKAISGAPWRLANWQLECQMDLEGSPHQLPGVTGGIREGTRVGRGWAKMLINAALDIDGPRVVSVDFVDATRMQIDVTFDRDIKTPAGVTTALPGHYVSLNNGTTYPNLTNVTAAIVSARTLRLTSTIGAFPLGATRADMWRGVPFDSNSAKADFVGLEADVDTNFLSKMITDTSGFDGGRGVLARPVMDKGLPVSLPIAITATNAMGSAVLRVRQAT